jgi:hypothetical protein
MFGIPDDDEWPGARQSIAFPLVKDVAIGVSLRETISPKNSFD